MTNKLGSSNPNRIPKPKERAVTKDRIPKLVNETLDKTSAFKIRIDLLIKWEKEKIEFKRIIAKFPKIEQGGLLKKLYKIEDKKNDIELEFDNWILGLIKESDGKVDKDGTPIVASKDGLKELEQMAYEDLKENKENLEEDVKDKLNYIMESFPLIMDSIRKYYGKDFHDAIKPIQKIACSSLIRVSKRKG